jgi:outer membrane receptor protein involved in Fe transport
MQHDLRLFADLQDRFPNAPWARDIRVSLTVANLLNDRQQVRDASGKTPLIYQPAYLDPLGRTVSLSLRKLMN